MNVVTRFPPSPTGNLHIGNARTALFNYLFTKHEGGKMYFRFEDTDKERNKKEFEDEILKSLDWLGIEYEWPDRYRQSEQTNVYKKYLHQLFDAGIAYEAEPSEADPAKKIIRFKNPNKKITFTDLIRGEVTVDTTDLEDFIIARNVDDPLYHLAVVVDDHEMGVTHVIRGEDHISNTPRQILILEALGFERPIYAHLPLILAKDRSKFSKRHGAATVGEYSKAGYLPDAVLNYLALLGWHPSDDQEIFSRAELIQRFTFDQVSKSGAIFDEEKFKWFNREYLLKLPPEEFKKRVQDFASDELKNSPMLDHLIPLIRDRISTFAEVADMEREGEFEYFMKAPGYDAKNLVWKKDPAPDGIKTRLEGVHTHLEAIDAKGWHQDTVKAAIWPYAEAEGRGGVLWPLRYALTGRDKSPDPFTVAGILGKDETLARINTALRMLGA
jgi:glutamyl-tRNA synthetase